NGKMESACGAPGASGMALPCPAMRLPGRRKEFHVVRRHHDQRGGTGGAGALGADDFRRCALRSGRRCAADAAVVPMKIGRLAGWYRWIEYLAFGRALERRRFAFLSRLASAK